MAAKHKKLAELQKKFKQLLNDNQSLPEHVRLKPAVQTHTRTHTHTYTHTHTVWQLMLSL